MLALARGKARFSLQFKPFFPASLLVPAGRAAMRGAVGGQKPETCSSESARDQASRSITNKYASRDGEVVAHEEIAICEVGPPHRRAIFQSCRGPRF